MSDLTPSAAVIPFSDTDAKAFHREDRAAAGVMIGLMTIIFFLGLVLYLAICLLML